MRTLEEIQQTFGGALRLRCCGLLYQEDQILLANHPALGAGGYFLSPPGGGIDFQESALTCLEREITEECGLQAEQYHFQCAGEYLHNGLHTIELFFEITQYVGTLAPGEEPELPGAMTSVQFYTFDFLNQLAPHQKHGLFQYAHTVVELQALAGFYQLEPTC